MHRRKAACVLSSWPELFEADDDERNRSELGIHESTVSRAVKGKYVQTPFGTIEMRIFFTTSLQSVGLDEDMSGMQAKRACRQPSMGKINKSRSRIKTW
ncbi:hypothetical protein Q5O89_03790 [Peribacillus frigoritolerans]|nr:hypothetical protein [Peribacillus frigoritolerans]